MIGVVTQRMVARLLPPGVEGSDDRRRFRLPVPPIKCAILHAQLAILLRDLGEQLSTRLHLEETIALLRPSRRRRQRRGHGSMLRCGQARHSRQAGHAQEAQREEPGDQCGQHAERHGHAQHAAPAPT